MFALEKHQKIAILVWLVVVIIVVIRDGQEDAILAGGILFIILLAILFYRLVAWLSGFGFPEYFAKDFGSENHPGPYAVFFWLLFVAACFLILFKVIP